ncbi:putative clathrin assembly protein [Tripterygium wilfordii]|uniref:Putative clathrin assembly protein n=1 Tax=Tripterygium wilfordii TaxID=458696 RepID=A0A7J7D5U0_TRIWF|nr:putative clathrin assembly protein At1g33340 [Tripterygium wilfordii]KAF5741639.1 putative clathrin assembly protein [Tripterygium wilfordii]
MGVYIQRKLRQALGSVKDHASVGKAMLHSHEGKAFSDIEIAVVRATGHDNSPIDDKQMHEILFLVSNSPGSIPFLAERISCRLGKTKDHLVALKTLLLVHRLLRGGNRCFEQQLRSAHASGHLQMIARIISDPPVSFLHKYASYLEERVGWVINQAGKLEPAVSGSLEFRCYHDKSMDLVFHKLPKCQAFIHRVLDFSPVDILSCDNLAQAAMNNTLKESFQVYMTYCEGVAALVNMFFDLTMPARALACKILKRASHQSQKLDNLYEKCKQMIGNKNLEYPLVEIITMDHVVALENCSVSTPTSPRSSPTPPMLSNRLTSSSKSQQVLGMNASDVTLFSWTMETKISKVWVVFEDENDLSLTSVK